MCARRWRWWPIGPCRRMLRRREGGCYDGRPVRPGVSGNWRERASGDGAGRRPSPSACGCLGRLTGRSPTRDACEGAGVLICKRSKARPVAQGLPPISIWAKDPGRGPAKDAATMTLLKTLYEKDLYPDLEEVGETLKHRDGLPL